MLIPVIRKNFNREINPLYIYIYTSGVRSVLYVVHLTHSPLWAYI